MTVFLAAPFTPQLAGLFLLGRPSSALVVRPVFKRAAAARAARAGAFLFACWIAVGGFFKTRVDMERVAAGRESSIHGLWDVEAVARDGAQVPLLITDHSLWRRLVVQSRGAAVIIPMSEVPDQPVGSGRPAPVGYSVPLDSPPARSRWFHFAVMERRNGWHSVTRCLTGIISS